MRSLRICICAMLCIVLVSCNNETNLENVKKGKTTGAISSIATDSKKMTINVMQDKMAGYPQGTMGEYQRYICYLEGRKGLSPLQRVAQNYRFPSRRLA